MIGEDAVIRVWHIQHKPKEANAGKPFSRVTPDGTEQVFQEAAVSMLNAMTPTDTRTTEIK